MVILTLNHRLTQLMNEGKIKFEKISPKKNGTMITCQVYDPDIEDPQTLRLMFVKPEVTNGDMDLTDARLRRLQIFSHRSAYGSDYFIAKFAQFVADGDGGTVNDMTVKGEFSA